MSDPARVPVAKVVAEYRQVRSAARRTSLLVAGFVLGWPLVGFRLASDPSVPSSVRHFFAAAVFPVGLLLILGAIFLVVVLASAGVEVSVGGARLRRRLLDAGFDRVSFEDAGAIYWHFADDVPAMIAAHEAFLIPGIPPDPDGILTVMRMLRDHRAETRARPTGAPDE